VFLDLILIPLKPVAFDLGPLVYRWFTSRKYQSTPLPVACANGSTDDLRLQNIAATELN